ncbi:TIR domain-containing protein [Streptomyces sp. NPDC013178]|uniref:TIR domain-containing protein n=1 Tax=Streptomyces sp. NPDC013178 TaxID=3155118 RepID=UPI0034107C5E
MTPSPTSRGSYDAFVSYSHAADSALAPALQRGLHRLAKPWNRPRALRVFRDQASLAANPDLWTTIEGALESSRYFILLASPESARSPWVRREIDFWKAHRGPETMLIVLTGGEIVWDHHRGDFQWERTTALPDGLRGWFQGEPLWVDLRWAAAEPNLSLNHGRFREAVGMLAAAVHGVSKDELDSEEVRQHARTVRLRRAGVGALTVLLVIALIMANLADERRREAEKQRRLAEEQRRLATVRALQAEAENLRDSDPLLSLRLSLAAGRVKPTAEAREGLITTLHRTRLAGRSVTGVGKHDQASYAPDGTLLATASDTGVTLWDTRDAVHPRRLVRLTGPLESVVSMTFSADGRLLATVGNVGLNPSDGIQRGTSSLMLWDLADRARPRRVLHWALQDAVAAAFSPDGTTMAVVTGRANGTLQLWDVTKPSAPRRLTGALPAYDSDTVMFSPDGRTLVTGSGYFTAKDGSLEPGSVTHTTGWTVWDIRDVRRPRAVARRPHFGIAVFSRTAPVLAVGNDRTLTLWDLRTPRTPRQLARLDHKDQVESVVFSPDGRSLVASVLDKTVFLRDVSDPAHPGRPVMLGEHTRPVDAAAFSRDGRTISLADQTGALTRWLTGSRAPVRVATLTMDAFRLAASAFSPDGRKLAVGGTGGKVWLWDTSDPTRPRRRTPLTGQLQRAETVSFNGDGSVLAVGSQAGEVNPDGRITLWDTSDLGAPRQLAEISTRSGVTAVALSPRRPALAAVGATLFGEPWFGLWDIRDPRHPVPTKLVNPYTPRGETSASASPDLPSLPFMGTTPAVFGPDGTTLALPGALWDVTKPSAPVLLPPRDSSDLQSMQFDSYDFAAFSGDGRHLVTTEGRALAVWSVGDEGRSFLSSTQVPDRLSQLDVHPAGHLIATGSPTGRAGLWSVTGSTPPTLATTLTDVMAEVVDVRFSGDRRTLAVTLDSGTVELWNLGDLPAIAADPTGAACAITGTGLSREEWQQYAPGLPYTATCP